MTVEAEPEALSIDLSRTAMLVIDTQNDFCAPGGMFDRAGLDISVVRNVIPSISASLTAVRAAGIQAVTIADLSMLVSTGGGERTEAEFRTLLQQAGFSLERAVPGAPLIEAAPV